MTRRWLVALCVTVVFAGWPTGAWAADFTVWGIQTFNPEADRLIEQAVREFGQQRGITAEYVVVPANILQERLAAGFESGSPPDVWQQVGQHIQYYIARDLVLPVDDLLQELRAVPGGIFESVISQAQYNGRIWALPLEIDVAPLHVRTDLLKQAGLDLPQTWDELREAAKKVQNPPFVYGFGLALGRSNDAESNLRNIIWSFGGQEFAEDGRTVVFDSPETRAAFQFVADMFKKDGTIPRSALTWDDSGNNRAYQGGQAAFVINPGSIYYYLQENDPELLRNTAMIPIPKGPGPKGRRGGEIGAWVWAISRQTKNPELAKDFLRYFYEPSRYQKIIESVGGRWVPIYRAQFETPFWKDNPWFQYYAEMAETGILAGHAGPPTPMAAEIMNSYIVSEAMQKVLVDDWSVEEAVSWAHQRMEEIVRSYQE